MYCEKCGEKIPDGVENCPNCTRKKLELDGEVFKFRHAAGAGSLSVSEIHHAVVFQKNQMVITRQKSFTAFTRKSKPAVSQTVAYHNIQSVRTRTDITPVEIPFILMCILFMIASGEFFYTILWLAAAVVSIIMSIRTVIILELNGDEILEIPYSGGKSIGTEFVEAVQTVMA